MCFLQNHTLLILCGAYGRNRVEAWWLKWPSGEPIQGQLPKVEGTSERTPGVYTVLWLFSFQLFSCLSLTTQDYREVHGVGVKLVEGG